MTARTRKTPRPIPSRSTARPSATPSSPWPTRWATASSPSARPGSSGPSVKARTSPTSCSGTWREEADGLPFGPGLQSQLCTRRRGRGGPAGGAADVSGIIHVAGPEVIDRVEFAREIALRVRPRHPADPRQADGRAGSGGAAAAERGTLDRAGWRPSILGMMRPLASALDDFRARLLDPELRQSSSPCRDSPPEADSVGRHRPRRQLPSDADLSQTPFGGATHRLRSTDPAAEATVPPSPGPSAAFAPWPWC